MPTHTSTIRHSQSVIQNPLVLITNDDGITSPGLRAAVRAALPLGEPLVAAIHFTRLVARRILATLLPFDVDLLKLDVPSDATLETPWRLTRVSRHTHFVPIPPQRGDLAEPMRMDYTTLAHPERTESDSDIYALMVDRVVSVAPLSLDLTSRVESREVETLLRDPTIL